MTAEEQGLYRNLLDEVWLRENNVIPDDPRILSRVSGDPEAWARSGAKVLRWMLKVDGGWTNQTALEVIKQSKRRSTNQKRYRERSLFSDNGTDNAVDNDPDNKPDSPDQDQYPSLVTRTESVKVNFTREAGNDWVEVYEGTVNYGKIGKALKPLVQKYTWPTVRPAWKLYLKSTAAEYASPYRFAETYGKWAQGVSTPAVNPNGVLYPPRRS
jgi:uncharacterized protein YdaU (DUF1376 family)